MKTTVLQLGLKTDVPQELRLSGTVEAGGIKWPQRIQILQRGELFFDLELTNFRTLAKFEGIWPISTLPRSPSRRTRSTR